MRLIYASEVTGCVICTPTASRARYVKAMAKELDAEIPDPISLECVSDARLQLFPYHHCGILIDESLEIIEKALTAYIGCSVTAITMSVEQKGATPEEEKRD